MPLVCSDCPVPIGMGTQHMRDWVQDDYGEAWWKRVCQFCLRVCWVKRRLRFYENDLLKTQRKSIQAEADLDKLKRTHEPQRETRQWLVSQVEAEKDCLGKLEI